MAKAAVQWTDARLDDLASALERTATRMEPLPAQLAVLSATVERLTDENRVLRAELAAAQRQLVQMSWGLAAALLSAAAAVIGALI